MNGAYPYRLSPIEPLAPGGVEPWQQSAPGTLPIHALYARFPAIRISTAYRFVSVGFSGPDFVNAAALVHTKESASALNTWLRALENQCGRERSGPRYGNRTLDIDIVLFDDWVSHGHEGLQIPRDELRHAFVLKPLAEIAPELLHPQCGCSIGELWKNHPQYTDQFSAVSLPV